LHYPTEQRQGSETLPDCSYHKSGVVMNKDRIKGAAKNVSGKAKTGLGKALGDEKLKNEGRADQIKGKVQNVGGGIKDSIRDADKASRDKP
jgi:uncharacterized protein YjbJ (UPF0337 family)